MAEDRHAIMGYAFLIDGSAVSWSSKWQEIVLLLMTESKYSGLRKHCNVQQFWIICSVVLYSEELPLSFTEKK
jgi:hypothetical protein